MNNDKLIKIAKNIGYAFHNLKEKEDKSNYLLQNYILSEANLVYFQNYLLMKIILMPIFQNKIIKFSIFSPFK